MTPNSQVGLEVPCDRCMRLPGQLCVSDSGRVLRVTHAVRFRAALSQPNSLRAYVDERMSWRWSA